MKKLLTLLFMCLTVSVRASQALWAWSWFGQRTVDENGTQVGTVGDYYVQGNEDGDGPYLTWRIKVTTEDLYEFYLPVYTDWGWEDGEYGMGVGNIPLGEGFGGHPGSQFDLLGNLSDYENSIFTMEIGLAYWEDLGDDYWDMTNFLIIGRGSVFGRELSDSVYDIGSIAPSNVRGWCPDIIVDSPVPEPSMTFMLVVGAMLIMLKRNINSDT